MLSQCASSKGVQALVVGAFAEHSADVHALVDGLAEAATPRTSHHYLVGPSKATGAKALLYAAFGAAAWNAQSALLQSRPSFAGAPAIESRVPGRRKLCRHLQRRPGGDPHAGRSPQPATRAPSTNFNDT
jgi:hypothetical protein